MDHLKTSRERQEFWYSTHRKPRFVPVRPANTCSDLDNADETKYEEVRSIPFDWIRQEQLSPKAEKRKFNIQELLKAHGFLVVSGVMEKDECNEALSLAWEWILAAATAEYAQQEMMDAVTTNKAYESLKNLPLNEIIDSPYFPRSAEGGMLPFYGSGHSTFAWKVRSNAKVKAVYEAFYSTTDLISSLDGIVLWHKNMKVRSILSMLFLRGNKGPRCDDIYLNSKDSKRPFQPTDPGWFHLDQNPAEKPGFEAVQGIVNLLPVTSAIGGNVIVAQSNKLFPEHYLNQQFYQERLRELQGDDWMEIPQHDNEAFANREILCCQLHPGDMLIWDSRTIHCSFPGQIMSKNDKVVFDDDNILTDEKSTYSNGLIRAATLVSMMPATYATHDVLNERRRAVDSCRTLTHWANKAAPLGDERKDEASRETDIVRRIKALPGQKVLLGCDDLTREQQELVSGVSKI